ncbi:helix-turn-helix domain-containing protein [Streptomyces sp. NPDC018610]|uniref:helix-turn-helix domain-containing protein n=1 Tax=Streptomyces sp. NPDC018610 TaxID=3365049 RepID=UPI0037B5287D
MPRWKALPEELDPQVKEFATQLRRLVDRSGLSVAALADRTGYSRTSWDRYLGGRLLAPKGAVVALAEVTGANPGHLTAVWELAERAWSRSELRHDRTMEAIRMAQARAALGEFGAAAPGTELTGGERDADGEPRDGSQGGGKASGGRAGGDGKAGDAREAGQGGRTDGADEGDGAAPVRPVPAGAGPAGVSPTVPVQPTVSDADAREGAGRERPVRDRPRTDASGPGTEPRAEASAPADARPGAAPASVPDAPSGADSTSVSDADSGSGSGSGPAVSSGGNSWRLAGYRGPSPVGGRSTAQASGIAGAPGPAGVAAPSATPRTPGDGTPSPYATGVPRPNVMGTSHPYGGAPFPVPDGASAPPVVHGAPPEEPGAAGAAGGGGFRQQVTMFLAGLVATLVVIAAVFHLTGGGSDGKAGRAGGSPSPSARTAVRLPPGVKCVGAGCTGKDAEAMGCSGALGTTARSVTVGTTLVEVRFSERCGAAWGRITQAAPGDQVRFTAGTRTETDTVDAAGDTIAYTPMVAVPDAARATACVTLAASGRQGCTT